MKVLLVYNMIHYRLVFTLRYIYSPLFKMDMKDIYSKVIEKRPSLKGKPIELFID